MVARMRWLIAAVVLGGSGCTTVLKWVSAREVLTMFNAKSEAPVAVPPGCEAVVPSALKDTLADAYFSTDALVSLQPEPLRNATLALLLAPPEDQRVFECLFKEASACAFGEVTVASLPFAAVPALASGSITQWERERDVQRVQHNLQRALRQVSSSCRALEGFALTNDLPAARIMLDRAFTAGLDQLREYQGRRALVRERGRSPVAWVFAGGAANGAFSAGAVWWLLNHHAMCGQACKDDRVDFVSGASTGTLIATVVKNYFTPTADAAERSTQLKLLLDKYTCSTNRELYCVQKQSVYDLLLNPAPQGRGLVRFDGLRCALQNNVGDEAHVRQKPEQFASVVRYDSGQVFHLSSIEAESRDAWVMALEGSVVEPLLAEPRKNIGTRFKGTFIDGGIRSGLPLLTPLRRGAERSLVFANTVLEGKPTLELANAAHIALRTIDLFTLPPIVGELALAEQEAVLRRQGEKDRCLARLGFDSAFVPAHDVELRCSQVIAMPLASPSLRGPMREPMKWLAAPIATPATPKSERIEDAYRSAWVFMPRSFPKGWAQVSRPRDGQSSVGWQDIGAVGYSFDPQEMWNLFALGVLTAQSRCREFSDLLGWHLPASCESLERAEDALISSRIPFEAQCVKKDLSLVDCESEPGPVMPPFSCAAQR